jgi:hypothetical protein
MRLGSRIGNSIGGFSDVSHSHWADSDLLRSALGVFDGKVYEALWKAAQREPLNETDVPDGYEVRRFFKFFGWPCIPCLWIRHVLGSSLHRVLLYPLSHHSFRDLLDLHRETILVPIVPVQLGRHV